MAKIKLQGISQRFDGVAAKDLKVGDVLIWNYGSKSEVVGIQPSKTGKSYAISCKSLQIRLIKLSRREKTLTAAYIAMLVASSMGSRLRSLQNTI